MSAITAQLNFTDVDFDPFSGLEIEKIAPSTESQREIWASCMIGGHDASRGFNESVTLHFKGRLDKKALENAFAKLINRHESLRALISANGQQVFILKERPLDIYYQDLSGIGDSARESVLNAYIKQDLLHSFCLLNGPLIKVSLFRLGENEHKLVFTSHHIICDGWSIGILLQDLSKLYSGYVQNIFTELPRAPRFSDYAFSEQKFENSTAYKKIEAFWLEKFNDEIPVLKLPTDFKRPAVRTYQSSRIDYRLDSQLVKDFKKIGFQNGCSFVITLMAAFEIFLHRLTGQDDIVVGLHAAGQSASGNQLLVGHCVNLLPVRVKHTAEVNFPEFLKIYKNLMFDAYEHQQITFGSLLKLLKVPRDPASVPLIPVIFNIDMGLTDGVDFYGLEFGLKSNPREFESFELFLNASGTESEFILEWSYNKQLFKKESVNRMIAGFETILRTIVSNPGVAIHDIHLSGKQEILEKLNSRNQTAQAYQEGNYLKDLIAATAGIKPDATAIVYANEELTFKQLNEKANRLAHYLIQQGAGVGQVIALSADRSADMLISLLAIVKTGATFLPVDPALPQERIAFMLADSGAAIVITNRKCQEKIKSQALHLSMEDALEACKHQPADNPQVVLTGSETAYIIYTSGSTGQPKGVLIPQQAILNYIQSSILAYASQDDGSAGSFVHLSLSFDASLTALFVPLVTGKIMVISSEAPLEVFNDANLPKYAPYDFIKLTPSQLALVKNSRHKDAGRAAKKWIIGGEALLKSHIDFLLSNGADVEIINEYGPTEATVGCISYRFNTGDEIAYGSNGILIGKPMPNVKIYILDQELNPVADGVEGELFISGIQVAAGYLNRPGLSSEKFMPNPFDGNGAERIYRTGDLGKFTESGDIEFLGRMDEQVKIRGYRIEPGEIEYLLLKQPDIREAVVIAREDQAEDKRLIAYIVTHTILPEAEFTEKAKEWEGNLKEALPEYMCPSLYVSISQVPLTTNGKLNKQELPKPDFAIHKASESNRALTEVEGAVTAIWEDILEIDAIGLHDDFFKLGGHSLLAIKLISIIKKRIEAEMDIMDVFNHPTIASLSAQIESRKKQSEKNKASQLLIPIKPAGSRVPLYIVSGGGGTVFKFKEFAEMLDAGQPIYGLQQPTLLEDIENFPDTIEGIAATYINEVQKHNPDGPYALSGHCLGGIIAFEMARQLQSAGKKVVSLILFDTEAIEKKKVAPAFKSLGNIPLKLKQAVLKSLLKIEFELFLLRKHPRLALMYKVERIKELAGNKNLKQENSGFEVFDKMSVMIQTALLNYQIEPYKGNLVVFYARSHYYFVDRENNVFYKKVNYSPDLNTWMQYSESVKFYEVEGEHSTIFDPQHASELARILQHHLNSSTEDTVGALLSS